jgi:cysteine synthase A
MSSNRYESILETIGNTPIVRLAKLSPAGVNVYAKVESFNPMGSVKDRLALGVIEDAERKGLLSPGQTVIEATSGNTGIGLAMVCARKGYPLVVTMAESFSVERRKMMRFLGAKVVLTPASEKGSGMLAKAVELAEKHGWFLCRQFENEANANAHSNTTAQEILRDFSDATLHYWVSGFGTGGTVKGVSRVLKKEMPATKIVVCEPDNSAILGSGIAQKRDVDGAPMGSHPTFRPHLMQGWSPDFIPKLAEDCIKENWIDQILSVSGKDALHYTRELAQQEGIFTGISAGATLAGAMKIAEQAKPGTNILCMLPDTGERYLSTPLFDDISADMTAEETLLSRSTPGFRFDQPSSAAPAASSPTQAPADTVQLVEDLVLDRDQPVVLFALEWCEFCWAVRKMLTHYGIPFRSVDLDSVAYQENDLGGQIRAVLRAKTGSVTIPQIFVGGKFIGGCTELFDAYIAEELQPLLKKNAVAYNDSLPSDPYSFLPKWLQAR